MSLVTLVFFSRLLLIFKDWVAEFVVNSPSSPSESRIGCEFAQSTVSADNGRALFWAGGGPGNEAEVIAGLLELPFHLEEIE